MNRRIQEEIQENRWNSKLDRNPRSESVTRCTIVSHATQIQQYYNVKPHVVSTYSEQEAVLNQALNGIFLIKENR